MIFFPYNFRTSFLTKIDKIFYHDLRYSHIICYWKEFFFNVNFCLIFVLFWGFFLYNLFLRYCTPPTYYFSIALITFTTFTFLYKYAIILRTCEDISFALKKIFKRQFNYEKTHKLKQLRSYFKDKIEIHFRVQYTFLSIKKIKLFY